MPHCLAASVREQPSSTKAIASRRHARAPSPALAARARSAAALWCLRVIAIA
jgi:hypothetical protein